MKNAYTTIKMTEAEINANPFVNVKGTADFYHFIGEKYAPYDKIKSIDCCKVNVAKNIQDAWFSYAKENDIKESDLTMLLLFSGPKALDTLEDNTVELEAGAIEY